MESILTIPILLAKMADDKLVIFFFFLLFFSGNRIWHFMQIVSTGSICMKYQVLFSGKNKKYFNMPSAENFTQSA